MICEFKVEGRIVTLYSVTGQRVGTVAGVKVGSIIDPVNDSLLSVLDLLTTVELIPIIKIDTPNFRSQNYMRVGIDQFIIKI